MVTQAPAPISAGFSQMRIGSLPLSNCLRTWNRIIPYYGNIVKLFQHFLSSENEISSM